MSQWNLYRVANTRPSVLTGFRVLPPRVGWRREYTELDTNIQQHSKVKFAISIFNIKCKVLHIGRCFVPARYMDFNPFRLILWECQNEDCVSFVS